MSAEEPLDVVYSVDDPNTAEIIANALRAEGIRCAVENEHQAGLTGLPAAPVRILVMAHDFDRARKIIESHGPL